MAHPGQNVREFRPLAGLHWAVQNDVPLVTVIVPTRPGQAEIRAVTAARRLDYPGAQLEIIVARGRQPAIQRNAALKAARGELVYFLDDDAEPRPENLRAGVAHFSDPAVQIVGGPNLCPPDAPRLEQVFAVVLASWLAFGPSRARYTPVGALRSSSEKELILCNMLARRQPLLELGGFDEALYPNEENALMDELERRGGRLLYDPHFAAQRRPRPTLRAFLKMLMTYGRGRAEQFRTHPTPGSALNFVPPLFVVYLVLLLAVTLSPLSSPLLWLPLGCYGLALLGQTAANASRHGVVRSGLALPLLAAAHIFYGLGFWRGLFTNLKRDRQAIAAEVNLERVPHG